MMAATRQPRRVAHCLVATGLSLCFAAPSQAQPRFAISYDPAPAEHEEMVSALRDSGLFEEAADFVNAALRLPRDVPVVFGTCAAPNAFYDPSAKRISFCYEFVELYGQMFAALPDMSDEELGNAIFGTSLFFLLHEMGHALVDVLDLPITGREEDAVDDLAALILLEAAADEEVLMAADGFSLLAANLEGDASELPFWDEHSLSAQRAFQLTCIVYGSNPQVYQGLVDDELLPQARAVRCPGEYEQKSESWDRILADHFSPTWQR